MTLRHVSRHGLSVRVCSADTCASGQAHASWHSLQRLAKGCCCCLLLLQVDRPCTLPVVQMTHPCALPLQMTDPCYLGQHLLIVARTETGKVRRKRWGSVWVESPAGMPDQARLLRAVCEQHSSLSLVSELGSLHASSYELWLGISQLT